MKAIALALVLVGCLAVVAKADKTIYADSGNHSIEELAELVCKSSKGTNHLIGRVSTFSEIVDFLSDISSQHKLYDCSRNYLVSLMQLVDVVETASDNVCGDEKIALIEDFHRRYVSKVSRYVRERKLGGDAPKIAKLFFMAYVSKVSAKCEEVALQALANSHHDLGEKELEAVKGLSLFTDSLGMTSLSQGYDKTYFIWNALDALAIAENEKFAKYLSASGDVRINVQLNEDRAKKLTGIKAICHYKLKPVYARSLLPVFRLVDMGYYPTDKLSSKLSSDPSSKSLFYIMQICESLTPIAFFAGEQLTEDQFVALTLDEASHLATLELPGLEELAKVSPKVNVAPSSLIVDQLNEEKTNVERVKARVNSRSKVVSRMLKVMWAQMKGKIKGFKLFRRNQNQQLEAVDVEQLEQQVAEPQIVEVDEENNRNAIERRKRNVVKEFFISAIAAFITFGFLVIYYIIKVVVMIIPTLFLIISIIFGNADAIGDLVNIWIINDPIGGAIMNKVLPPY